jgi:DNA-binding transcriptional regulator LsrR (DeoR family)
MAKVVIQYRNLLPVTGHPKPAIAKSLGISASHVSALLAEARREGILGPAIPGRAGELPGPTAQ